MPKTQTELLTELFTSEMNKYHHGDGYKIMKKVGDDCHCHTQCEKCKKGKPLTTCKHCKPENFQEDELTPFLKEIKSLIQDHFWHTENCGWDYYGHNGYYCGCGKQDSIEEEIKEFIAIFRKYKELL